MDNIDRNALRRLAQIAWDNRGQLALGADDIEQTLIGWMAVGTTAEAEAAAELLAARRAAESKQVTFDRLLKTGPVA